MPSDQEYRSSHLDRMFAESRTIVVAGPVVAVEVSDVRAVLSAAGSVVRSRLGLVPDRTERRWQRQQPVLARIVERPELDPGGDLDMGELITTINARAHKDCPIEVFVCGRYIVVDYSHGLGDGRLGEILTSAMLSGDTSAAEEIAASIPTAALWQACARTFGRAPQLLRQVKALRAADRESAQSHNPEQRPTRWRDQMRCSVRTMDAEQVSALRAAAKSTAPGATTNSVSTAIWMEALREAGAQVDPRVMVLMNCRRYLPPKYQLANGNFAFAMPVDLPNSPVEIAAKVRAITSSGWPLTTLAMAELKSRRSGDGGGDSSESAQFGQGMRLAVSDMGNLVRFEPAPWDPTSGTPRITAFLESDGPDSVALIIIDFRGHRTFTATYSTESIDPEVVERALDRMCAEPLRLLEATLR